MFSLPQINVPVLGLVENMAYFTPAELPENKYYIFGKEGVRNKAEELSLPFLGEIPLVQSIRESGDAGRPAVLQMDTPQAKAFIDLTVQVVKALEERNVKLEPTAKVEITHMDGCAPK
jgi:ATP-binding protein involved in chromosome partitioning